MITSLQAQKPKILVVLHQERSSAGRVGKVLLDLGYQLDICRPPLGDKLPKSLCDHAGAVMFGGPMSANDPDEFVGREINWLDVPLKENKPFLGICLGAQMLVKQLGKKVYSHPKGMVEIGWYPLEATAAGKALMDWPDMAYQFHREGFELPDGALHLASSPDYPNQAFKYGDHAWGIQFHAELTLTMMHSWTVRGANRFTMPGAQDRHAHLHGRLLYDAALLNWLKAFLPIVFADSLPKPKLQNFTENSYQQV
jgi:GMP synthase (glutamine-hydrolysing)